MPARAPQTTKGQERALRELGQRIRDHRKRLKVSAIATSEAAGISRVTLHRIEKGEPSVAISAYLSVISALGLILELADLKQKRDKQKSLTKEIPQKIRVASYKQLKRLAWQLKGTKEVSPEEALDIYERNWRHIDIHSMEARERKLLEALLAAFGRERLLV